MLTGRFRTMRQKPNLKHSDMEKFKIITVMLTALVAIIAGAGSINYGFETAQHIYSVCGALTIVTVSFKAIRYYASRME